MATLNDILGLCKCAVTVEVNDHRNCYMTAQEKIEENEEWFMNTPQDIIDEMIKRDTIISVQCYQHTPNGFYIVNHYDIDAAIDEMFKALSQ